MAQLLDGKNVAQEIQDKVQAGVEALAGRRITPRLVVIQVGENPASSIYVRNKAKSSEAVGMRSRILHLPVETPEADLLEQVDALNADGEVDGILVQLPLPEHMDSFKVLCRIDPAKDVDGFHPHNVGLLSIGKPALAPCTPAGILYMLDHYKIPLAGTDAVVIGRSNIVGKPMAALLIQRNATVTVCHSKTKDLPAVAARADLLVAAMGRPGFVMAEMVKPGAVVVDVGMNTLTERAQVERFFGADARKMQTYNEKGSVLIGDVDYVRVKGKAGWITPVPGGVGPLTVAMLLMNCLTAAKLRRNI
jgi:methylenetetrahydrofolate dehydrogenase (NADP+)/methenyltetrahydrofolate cyclohydrolase